MSDRWQQWCADAAAAADHPNEWPALCNPLRMRLWSLPRTDRDAAGLLADLWRKSSADLKAIWLAPLLENNELPAAFRHALADEAARAAPRPCNAALQVLGDGGELQTAHWRQLARRARQERGELVPPSDCAVFIARHAPPELLPTVALTAFRHGPEDADDRTVALGNIGRAGPQRAVAWCLALARLGACHLELCQSAAHALANGGDRELWTAVIAAVAGADRGLDAWARWTALEGLCHANPARALPAVLAAWRAGGDDLPAGFADGVAAQARSLDPSLTDHSALRAASAAVAPMPPLPKLQLRVMSRDARVARQAAMQWQAAGGDPDWLLQRARLEKTLVQRGLLLGSLLPLVDDAAELPADWGCAAEVISASERMALQAEEDAFIGA